MLHTTISRQILLITALICLAITCTHAEEERLVIENDSGDSVLSFSDNGLISFNPEMVGSSFIQSSSTDIGRMDMGYGGTGGGNMEFYSKEYGGREGQCKFIYGGGATLGSIHFTHYDGAGTWEDMMSIDHAGYMRMNGGAYCDGQSWINLSSRDAKENITELTTEDALKTLQELTPVSFNYKKDKAEKTLGFIAEDVPQMVATKDRKGTNAMDFVALLTKVVQEQQKVVQEQQKELNALRTEINAIKLR